MAMSNMTCSTTKTVLLLLLAEVYDRWPAGGDIPREEITAWLDSRLTHWRFAPDPDEVQQARARIAAMERERDGLLAAVLKAVTDEPECPDSMPDGMWMAMAEHKDVAEEAVRIAVRHAKAGIHDRIVEAISPARAGKGDK